MSDSVRANHGGVRLSTDYCGYWLRNIAKDDKLGWLVWEDDYDEEPHRKLAHMACGW